MAKQSTITNELGEWSVLVDANFAVENNWYYKYTLDKPSEKAIALGLKYCPNNKGNRNG